MAVRFQMLRVVAIQPLGHGARRRIAQEGVELLEADWLLAPAHARRGAGRPGAPLHQLPEGRARALDGLRVVAHESQQLVRSAGRVAGADDSGHRIGGPLVAIGQVARHGRSARLAICPAEFARQRALRLPRLVRRAAQPAGRAQVVAQVGEPAEQLAAVVDELVEPVGPVQQPAAPHVVENLVPHRFAHWRDVVRRGRRQVGRAAGRGGLGA